MAPRLHIDTIHVVESLTEGRTGLRLSGPLKAMGVQSEPQVDVRFWSVRTAAEVLSALERIAAETRDRIRSPLLHIEAHGNIDGIEICIGDFLRWLDFKRELVDINQAGRMHLLVLLAACQGVWLMQNIQPPDRAPFATMIGPSRDVSGPEIEKGCLAFYETLFARHDVGAALRTMNDATGYGTFEAVTSEAAFRAVWRAYLAETTDEVIEGRGTAHPGHGR